MAIAFHYKRGNYQSIFSCANIEKGFQVQEWYFRRVEKGKSLNLADLQDFPGGEIQIKSISEGREML